jgi:hypothetical protein
MNRRSYKGKSCGIKIWFLIYDRHKLTGAALSDILFLLKESVPEVNWPIETRTKGRKCILLS